VVLRPFQRFLAAGLIAAILSPVAAIAQTGPDTGPAVAAAASVEADGSRTRLKVVLSKPVTPAAHLMERPDRVIIDMPEVTFHLPAGSGGKREGLIASYRYGLFAPGQSRVVIDLAQPATVASLKVEASSDGTSILTLELAKAERDEFRKAAADAAAKAKAATPRVAAPVPDADPRPLIVLDPGHGGIDPGATSLVGTSEKDIVLTFADTLKKRLQDTGRYQVLLTREKDQFLSLEERVKFAQEAKADLFVSIHADSISGGQEVRGLTVYTRADRASDADSARLAERENKADSAAGLDSVERSDEVVDILQDLTLRETRGFSNGFASKLVEQLETIARLNKNSRREARFWVLRAHDVPSVLLELGYLSSKKDYDLLTSEEWRGKATLAITSAIDRFFSARLPKSGAAAAVLP
jgi:N-acetylmuramoyl-L-alanine amidase